MHNKAHVSAFVHRHHQDILASENTFNRFLAALLRCNADVLPQLVNNEEIETWIENKVLRISQRQILVDEPIHVQLAVALFIEWLTRENGLSTLSPSNISQSVVRTMLKALCHQDQWTAVSFVLTHLHEAMMKVSQDKFDDSDNPFLLNSQQLMMQLIFEKVIKWSLYTAKGNGQLHDLLTLMLDLNVRPSETVIKCDSQTLLFCVNFA